MGIGEGASVGAGMFSEVEPSFAKPGGGVAPSNVVC
jgi:hypothetical protein